ncbi:MAG: hypothetical protein H0X31_08755 [Nostocaceae cyanobacterium]|nr:hypothetical protein [Nostocaceae cyanobacterium]
MLKQILTSGSILALLLGGSIAAEATIKQPLFLSQTENTPSNPPASDNSAPRGPNDATPPVAPDRPNSSPARPSSSPDNSTSPVSPGVNDQKSPDRRTPSPDNSTSPVSPGSNDPMTPPAPIPVSPGGNDPANSPSTPPPNAGNGDPGAPPKPDKTTSQASTTSCDVEARRPTGGSSRIRSQMLDDCSQSR